MNSTTQISENEQRKIKGTLKPVNHIRGISLLHIPGLDDRISADNGMINTDDISEKTDESASCIG